MSTSTLPLAAPISKFICTEKYELIPSLLFLRIEEMAFSTSEGIPLYVDFCWILFIYLLN